MKIKKHTIEIRDRRPHGYVYAFCTYCNWFGPLRSGKTDHPVTLAAGDGRLHQRFPEAR